MADRQVFTTTAIVARTSQARFPHTLAVYGPMCRSADGSGSKKTAFLKEGGKHGSLKGTTDGYASHNFSSVGERTRAGRDEIQLAPGRKGLMQRDTRARHTQNVQSRFREKNGKREEDRGWREGRSAGRLQEMGYDWDQGGEELQR